MKAWPAGCRTRMRPSRRGCAAGAVLLGKLAMTEGAGADHHPERAGRSIRGARRIGPASRRAARAWRWRPALPRRARHRHRRVDPLPSAACGVTGLKPTWGRVSRHGIFPLAASLDHVGPMARSAADSACVRRHRRPRPDDPTASPSPPRIWARSTAATEGIDDRSRPRLVPRRRRPRNRRRLRGGRRWARSPPPRRPPERRGEACPTPRAALAAGWVPAYQRGRGRARARGAVPREHREDYGPSLGALVHIGGSLADGQLCPRPIWRPGGRSRPGSKAGLFDDQSSCSPRRRCRCGCRHSRTCPGRDPYTDPRRGCCVSPQLWNFAGNPTLSLPCGVDRSGLPIGLELIGAPMLGE